MTYTPHLPTPEQRKETIAHLKEAGQVLDLGSAPVKRWMTPNPTALEPSEPIKHALFLMAHNGFRHIPLVDESGRPQAIMTVRHMVEYIERLSPEVAPS